MCKTLRGVSKTQCIPTFLTFPLVPSLQEHCHHDGGPRRCLGLHRSHHAHQLAKVTYQRYDIVFV